jgi:uncharacterized membrane protein YuzA (DUF378 family)
MPDPGPSANSANDTAQEKFLFAEYQALISLDSSRNDRLDRFLTIFMTLAAAPWALYALVLKDHAGVPSISAIPFPVAAAFLLIGVLGALVSMMFIQMRFTIILYTRALNSIRGYFLAPDTLSFRLPSDPKKPPYHEKGNYIQFAVAGMALVNSGYIGLALFNLISWPHGPLVHALCFVLLGLALWVFHMRYYSSQAHRRESHSHGSRELKWSK